MVDNAVEQNFFEGTCTNIRDASVRVLGSGVPLRYLQMVDDTLENFCSRDCDSCPVNLARNGTKVVLDTAGSIALAAIDALEALALRTAAITKAGQDA